MIDIFLQVLLLALVSLLPVYFLHRNNLSQKLTLEEQIKSEQQTKRLQLERELEEERLREENEEKEKLQQMSLEKQKQREKILSELLATEETYLKQLQYLSDYFIVPVKEKQLLSQKVFESIFPVDINIIRNVNKGFYHQLKKVLASKRSLKDEGSGSELNEQNIKELQKLISENEEGSDQVQQEDNLMKFTFDSRKDPVYNVSKLVLHFAPAFKLYVGFISKYGKSIEALSNETEKPNKKLNAFLDEQLNVLIEKGENGTVHDYLVTMIQRIPRYRLLLDELLKHTEGDNRDLLGAAIKQISDTAKFCNEKDREYEMAVKMFALQAKIQLKAEHRSPGRRLISEYPSDQFNIKLSNLKQKGSTKGDLYIFNDSIVFHKKKSKSTLNLLSAMAKSKPSTIQYIRRNTSTPYGTVVDIQIHCDDEDNTDNSTDQPKSLSITTTFSKDDSEEHVKRDFVLVCSSNISKQLADECKQLMK